LNSTTTGLGIYGSSTIGNGTATGGLTINGTATTTNLIFTSLASTLLKVNAQGQVSAAVSGTDYAAFGYPFVGNATTTLLAFNGGLTSFASTTIGNGTQVGGLTVNGGATTTGNQYVAGTLNAG